MKLQTDRIMGDHPLHSNSPPRRIHLRTMVKAIAMTARMEWAVASSLLTHNHRRQPRNVEDPIRPEVFPQFAADNLKARRQTLRHPFQYSLPVVGMRHQPASRETEMIDLPMQEAVARLQMHRIPLPV
jgi:hypothetical protein